MRELSSSSTASSYWWRLDERLRAREHRLDAAALVGGDAALEEAGVDAEPRRATRSSRASGAVFPRSIWLTYSFEKRSPARSVWVSPAATRSWRTRSPRRALPGWAAMRICVVTAVRGITLLGEVKRILDFGASAHFGISPEKVMRTAETR